MRYQLSFLGFPTPCGCEHSKFSEYRAAPTFSYREEGGNTFLRKVEELKTSHSAKTERKLASKRQPENLKIYKKAKSYILIYKYYPNFFVWLTVHLELCSYTEPTRCAVLYFTSLPRGVATK
jgi:hypothetical protein